MRINVGAAREELEHRIRDKDTALRELQHRVENNLQIIAALIRLEARSVPSGTPREPFDRLAGRGKGTRVRIIFLRRVN